MNLITFQKQGKEKQDAIIAAGVEEFSQKTFKDASTDVIVQKCGISKGLLFHYFGSKKNFYLYCLSCALDNLMEKSDLSNGDFYSILFSVMDAKLALCARYPAQTRFVNMAARDMSTQIREDKAELFMKYSAQRHVMSAAVIEQALATLSLKPHDIGKVQEALLLYTNAVISKYLVAYQHNPDAFFENAAQIKIEIKEFIDFMLYGIADK